MDPKFNIGDKVRMKPGYSSEKEDHNYIGYGYSANKKVTIRRRKKDYSGTFGHQWIYFFEEQSDGVAEGALLSLCEERNRKLIEIGI